MNVTTKANYNRTNVLFPDTSLIVSEGGSIREVKYWKSMAQTPHNLALWGDSPQVQWFISTKEYLARAEEGLL